MAKNNSGNSIVVSLKEILELREGHGRSTLARLFTQNDKDDFTFNSRAGLRGDDDMTDARDSAVKESFYEDALKKRVISMRLGFDEEKSTTPFHENFKAISDKQSKHKLSLATLSTSKYDRKDGLEYSNTTFSFSDPSQERLQQLARPMDRHCWKVAEPVRSERYNLAAARKSRSRSRSPQSRGSFQHFLKRSDEWDKQRQSSRERQRTHEQEIDKASCGNPRLVAKRSVKLAEIARFKELQQILRPGDSPAKLPLQGHELERGPGADPPSPQRDSSKENVDANLNVFERLALRGNHEAKKIRRDSQEPFLTGTAAAKNSSRQRSPSPLRSKRSEQRRRSRSADVASDSIDNGRGKNCIRLNISEIIDPADKESSERSRAVSHSRATTPRGRDSKQARENVNKRLAEGLAASKARSESREKERAKKQAYAERHGSPCERRAFQPDLCAPKTDEIMRTRYSFEERMRRSVEDYLIRVEVCKRLYPSEGSTHVQRNNNTSNTAGSPLHSAGSRENISSSSNNNSGANLTARRVSRSVSTPRSSTRHVMDLLSPNYRTPGGSTTASFVGGGSMSRSRSSSPGGREGFSFGRERRMLPRSVKVVESPRERSLLKRQLNNSICSPTLTSPPPPPPPPPTTAGSTRFNVLQTDGGGDWNRADIIVDSSIV